MHALYTFGATFSALSMAATVGPLSVPHEVTQGRSVDEPSPLVVRVAIFAADQGRPESYRDFIDRHLFPTLRTVPGYMGTLLGHDRQTGQMISLSLWRSEADAAAGEDAVGRAIRALSPGSAPRASMVNKYVIEYRDMKNP